jgi:hypothetical protein
MAPIIITACFIEMFGLLLMNKKNFYYNTYGYYNYIHSIIKKNVKFQWLQRGVYNINNEQKKNAFMKK